MGAGPKRNRAALSFKEEELGRGGGESSGRRLPPLPRKMQGRKCPSPPSQLSNPSPAAVLPGHVSAGWLPVRPKDFLKPPLLSARKSCESVRREIPANPTPVAATRALGSRTPRAELHSSAPTALRKGETQTARRGCEWAAVCSQELLRMPQSGEAPGVTSLGSRSESPRIPCNSTPPPLPRCPRTTTTPKSPLRCTQPSKHRS